MIPLKVLSLGAGVQSSTVLLMSCRGDLPRIDAAVFADTQWEPPEVYNNLDWLTVEAAKIGVPVYRVTAGNLRQHTMEGFVKGSKTQGQRYVTMPLYVLGSDGSCGMLKRQCTTEYKIVPIERFIRRELLGLKPGERAPINAVEQWFGISADELRRVRIAKEHWKHNIYPLIGIPTKLLNHPYTRLMCEDWLEKHYPQRQIPRSACLVCPFHTDAEWRQIKQNPKQWADVVASDEAIRFPDGMRGQVFLHSARIPLADVDLRTDEDRGQLTFGFRAECLGYCGN